MDFPTIYKYTSRLSLLFVEDDTSLREASAELFRDLFSHVDTAVDGKEGLEKYLAFQEETGNHYDLVITDIQMPKMNGIDLVKNIYRHNPKQTVIVLSAHNESDYLIELVNLGIAQFLLKPFDYGKMMSILTTICKGIDKPENAEKEDTGLVDLGESFEWDKQKSVLLENGQHVKLTKKELLLLKLFMDNKNNICSNELIFHTLWEDDDEKASVETLKSIISRLRKKIPGGLIENIYSMGYRLILP